MAQPVNIVRAIDVAFSQNTAQGVAATAKAVSTAEAEARRHAICVPRTLEAKAGIANDPAGT